jgi:S-(hydroxymethyl)glutathione dehydrogenase/alcohol dehydrogenase
MKTQAALLVQTGQPLVIADIGIPSLKPGQSLIEISYSGACGTQVMEWRGDKGEDKWLPHCLGHEGSGVVLETGPGVSKVKAGDKVVLSWIKGSGIEAGGTVYTWEGRNVNSGPVTTFQRHALVSENRLTTIPKGLEMDLAVLLGCAAPTGMGAVLNVLNLRPGDTIAIFGAGGIGLNACAAAAISGASTIIAIDPSPTRRSLAKIYGATHVVNPSESDPVEAIKAIIAQGVDLAVEASGIPEVMNQALQSTRQQGGRAVVIGNAKHGSSLNLNPSIFNQGKSLLGTWGGDSVPDRDYSRYGRMIAGAKFPMRDLLSKPYSLLDINDAMSDLAAGTIGRPLIDMKL